MSFITSSRVVASPAVTPRGVAITPFVAPSVTYAAPPTYAAAPSYGSAPAAPTTYVAPASAASVFSVPQGCPMSLVGQQDAPWGGGCPWQVDKTAFKQFVKLAIEVPSSKERKELYGFLSECFLDADGDRDGLVGVDEFDFLIEKAASLPRRFGMAPSWVECYGDVAHRQQARGQMFAQMDKHQRGKIGLEEWVEFTMAHIAEKVRTMQMNQLDFAHLERAGPDQFIQYLQIAVADRHSENYKSLYEFLFKSFVESDREEKGAIHFEQFDALIEDVAKAPRTLGLAPSSAQSYPTEAAKRAARGAEFRQMDTDNSGTVTFDKFLNWCMTHIAGKVSQGPAIAFAQPVQAVQYAAPVQYAATPPVAAPMTYAAPVTYAAAPVTYAAPATYAAAPTTYIRR